MNGRILVTFLRLAVLLTFSASGAIALAQGTAWDLGNRGQLKEQGEMIKWLYANKPPATEQWVIDIKVVKVYFLKDYAYDIPAEGEEDSLKGQESLKSVDTKYHVFNELRRVLLDVAAAPQEIDQLRVGWPDRISTFLSRLKTNKIPRNNVAVLSSFIDDWYKVVSSEVDKVPVAEKKSLLQKACRQGAFQISSLAAEVDMEMTKEAGSTASSGQASGSNAITGGSGNSVSYHRSDVMHERLMNGIYRRHNRRTNQIERITARR